MLDPQGYRSELRTYLTGFALALVLTIVPFAMIVVGGLSAGLTMAVVGVLAVVQVVVHLRFFMGLDLSERKREDLDLILFSTLV
nr:cytochrome-c oxidase [Desulfuromonadales bacterium]